MLENRKIFTLHAILNRVQQVFDELMLGKYFWVKVEVLKVNKDRRGHYYLELVEQVDDQVLARCRATIWQRNVERCVIDGGEELDKVVKEGAEILCYGEAIFHPVYGFSLHVIHVDYAFSLGEIERKKQMALMQLQQKGLLQLNKNQSHPLVLQNIAVVGSIGTSGYEDFVQHLIQNPYHFAFNLTYFDTQVQGEEASANIIKQLEVVTQGAFDVVVLIRGGGSKFDLDVFNAIGVAEQIAQMPQAVFTGIGHETDSTVADYVAHTYFKTPSAVAAFIIERALQFQVFLEQMEQGIRENAKRVVTYYQTALQQVEERVTNLSTSHLMEEEAKLTQQSTALGYLVKQLTQVAKSDLRWTEQAIAVETTTLLKKRNNGLFDQVARLSLWGKQKVALEQQQLHLLQEMITTQVRHTLTRVNLQLTQTTALLSLYDMEHLLKRGFAIIRHQGKVVTEQTVLHQGDELELTLYNKQYKITLASIEEVTAWKNLHMKKPQQN
ncbi:MAG: exodeoxyribonuclease VII large subunit [Myroides odoratus]|jgi:exodeoxyribonuclease VII large subunit|nr:exodeoxyribonuclease VII large subunit [Myroides odoratus]